MAYNKTQWRNNSSPDLDATNLNKIEQGIYENSVAVENHENRLTNCEQANVILDNKISDVAGKVNDLIPATLAETKSFLGLE